MKVSIVIPAYNGWTMTHSLLLDLYKHTSKDTEIIVVDDCSTDKEVSDGLAWWKGGMLSGRLRVFVNEVNSGFLRTCNFGVSKATGDIVILISNDVKISGDIEKSVLGSFDSESPTLVGARLLDIDTGWNTFNGVTYPYLEGWFLAFRKEEWLKFGGFDERYRPYDFEDVDISTTYKHFGGNLVWVDLPAFHLGAQTYKYSLEREAQTKRNQLKFKEKWCG